MNPPHPRQFRRDGMYHKVGASKQMAPKSTSTSPRGDTTPPNQPPTAPPEPKTDVQVKLENRIATEKDERARDAALASDLAVRLQDDKPKAAAVDKAFTAIATAHADTVRALEDALAAVSEPSSAANVIDRLVAARKARTATTGKPTAAALMTTIIERRKAKASVAAALAKTSTAPTPVYITAEQQARKVAEHLENGVLRGQPLTYLHQRQATTALAEVQAARKALTGLDATYAPRYRVLAGRAGVAATKTATPSVVVLSSEVFTATAPSNPRWAGTSGQKRRAEIEALLKDTDAEYKDARAELAVNLQAATGRAMTAAAQCGFPIVEKAKKS
jgi:hypothetical protein